MIKPVSFSVVIPSLFFLSLLGRQAAQHSTLMAPSCLTLEELHCSLQHLMLPQHNTETPDFISEASTGLQSRMKSGSMPCPKPKCSCPLHHAGSHIAWQECCCTHPHSSFKLLSPVSQGAICFEYSMSFLPLYALGLIQKSFWAHTENT